MHLFLVDVSECKRVCAYPAFTCVPSHSSFIYGDTSPPCLIHEISNDRVQTRSSLTITASSTPPTTPGPPTCKISLSAKASRRHQSPFISEEAPSTTKLLLSRHLHANLSRDRLLQHSHKLLLCQHRLKLRNIRLHQLFHQRSRSNRRCQLLIYHLGRTGLESAPSIRELGGAEEHLPEDLGVGLIGELLR